MRKNIEKINLGVVKKVVYVVFTAIFVIILTVCFSLTVHSQSVHNTMIENKEQVDRLESEYLKAMRHTLKSYGCENAGITMTKVYGEDKSSYEVLIHHSNLQYLDEEAMNNLSDQLMHLIHDFPNADFSFAFSA